MAESPEKLFAEAKEIIWQDKATSEKMSAETQARLLTICQQLVELIVSLLLYGSAQNGDIFWGHIFLLLRRDFSYELKAAAAVSVDSQGPLLHINPYMLLALCKNMDELQARIQHEGYHLLYNHVGLYGEQFRGNDDLQQLAISIGTDAEINQWLEHMPEGSVSLDNVKHLTEKETVPEKAGSLEYVQELTLAFQEEEARFVEAQQVDSSAEKKKSENSSSSSNDESQDLTASEAVTGKNSANEESDDSENSDNSKDADDFQPKELKREEARRAINKKDGVSRQQEEVSDEHASWAESVSPAYAKELTKELFDSAEDQAREGGKSRGLLPAHIEEALAHLHQPHQLPWQVYFKKALSFMPKGKCPSIHRLNRRTPERLEKRGKLTGEGKNVLVFIDASGSMATDELTQALAECYQLTKMQNIRLFLGQIDTEVADFYEIKRPQDLKFERRASGGTKMQAAFDYLAEHHFDQRSQLVFFTDGYIEDKVDTRGYKHVLWILTSPDYQLPDGIWGQIAYLKRRGNE